MRRRIDCTAQKEMDKLLLYIVLFYNNANETVKFNLQQKIIKQGNSKAGRDSNM